jgi:hypothetical protein
LAHVFDPYPQLEHRYDKLGHREARSFEDAAKASGALHTVGVRTVGGGWAWRAGYRSLAQSQTLAPQAAQVPVS